MSRRSGRGRFHFRFGELPTDLVWAVCVVFVLHEIVPLPKDAGLLIQVVHHLAVLLTTVFGRLAWRAWRNRESMRILLDALHKQRSEPPLREFLEREVEGSVKRGMKLLARGGTTLEKEELQEFVRACFADASWSYQGIDSHCPSDYYKRYPNFLQDHEAGLGAGRGPSVRILAVDAESLKDDFRSHSDTFKTFVKWHVDNGVILLQIAPDKAREFASTHGVTIDVALWVDDYAVQFGLASERVTVQYVSVDDSRYRDLLAYSRAVNRAASRLSVEDGQLSIRSRTDAEKGEALVVLE